MPSPTPTGITLKTGSTAIIVYIADEEPINIGTLLNSISNGYLVQSGSAATVWTAEDNLYYETNKAVRFVQGADNFDYLEEANVLFKQDPV